MFSIFVARPSARVRRALAIGAALAALSAPSIGTAQDLSLSDALFRVASGDPVVAANAARLQAAEAGINQADVRPRDVVGIDVEDFAGTGPYSPIERSQTTAWYERTWERGGKREARVGAARSQLGVATERNRLRMLDLLAQVQAAWVEALAAQATIPIAEQRLAEAQRIEAEVGRRVGRALDPLFAAERARTAVAQAEIALDQARETARIARAALASYWGGTADYSLQTASFGILDPTTVQAESSPDLAALSAEREAAGARLRLAETGNVGDPTGRVGLRHFGQGNDVAIIVGASIPLGSRAANRGNVARAQADAQAAEAEIAVMRVQVEREISRLEAQRAAILTEVSRIDREVLPSAERAVVLVRDGFARGGTAFTFLEVSQAQQAVTDARSRRVELLRQFHLAGARLDRLTGRHTPLLASAEIR
ncbi:TolC family protein [Sphingobium wenxiniae]|jgi:outer membrane protein, heavy metal efflux system|uniref:Cobalt-zinc-cadmium efflux system outer membrane protein n=1 Tax=Sphingobium wenxiniae (strain DSM 21828 / CGMCC 1.7748 / JZ-1) TaxID=595605 RepID=A0A562K983_SPHWJ|nr:cobalt-zinc-cadmium efflux system outer membrane protein [Sphingobium wenxiniae]